MNSLIRLIVVLGVIATVAGFLLSGSFEMTKEPIAEQKRQELLASLNAVFPPYDNRPGEDIKKISLGKDKRGRELEQTFYFARSKGQLLGTAFKVLTAEGYGGNIEIMMGVDPAGRLLGIEILSHLETPGLGDNIGRNKPWRDSFKGRSLYDDKKKCCVVKKDGGDIDQFAGATISPRAVSGAVQKGLVLFEQQFGLKK